jgi:hypothetical protein
VASGAKYETVHRDTQPRNPEPREPVAQTRAADQRGIELDPVIQRGAIANRDVDVLSEGSAAVEIDEHFRARKARRAREDQRQRGPAEPRSLAHPSTSVVRSYR